MRSLQAILTTSVSRNPDAPAIESGNIRISYKELADRSSRLAVELEGLGVRKGDRIGLLLPKCAGVYAGIFAILTTGGVVVPLDTRFPPQRIADIVKRCSMEWLITDRERAALLRSTNCCRFVVLDPLAQDPIGVVNPQRGRPLGVPREPGGPTPAVPARDHDLAYILFTSGTSGVPKGVAISHRAALWFVNWAIDYFQLSSDDRILNIAPFIFDLSVFDVYATLGAGGTIVPLADGHAIFPARVADVIATQRISTLYLTPSQLRPLVTDGMLEARDLSALRRVLIAGEVLDVDLARNLLRSLPGVACYNLYGPTETNVCTAHLLDAEELAAATEVPIGRPCLGCDIFLVDDAGHRIHVPGRVGQIVVSSPGSMTGYWGDGKATRRVLQRLGSGNVLYRTGDLGVRSAAGYLLFRGRIDRQIKHRGYRIEPEEIELVLRSHPGVTDALVILLQETPNAEPTNRLVAYVSLSSPGGVSARALIEHCRKSLPPFALPEEIVICARLPTTLTGKRLRAVPPTT